MARGIRMPVGFMCLLIAAAMGVAACTSAAPSAAAPAELVSQIPSPFDSTTPQAPGTYVGTVDGSSASIAFVVQNGKLLAYLCDGDTQWDWFGGSVANDQIDVTSPRNSHLVATVSSAAVSGTIAILGSQPLTFSAHPAGTTEGLFRAKETVDGQELTLGWIVTTDRLVGLDEDGATGIKNKTKVTTTGTAPRPSTGTGGTSGSGNQAQECDNFITYNGVGGCDLSCGTMEALLNGRLGHDTTGIGHDKRVEFATLTANLVAQMSENGC
jgi:hypothetical protein